MTSRFRPATDLMRCAETSTATTPSGSTNNGGSFSAPKLKRYVQTAESLLACDDPPSTCLPVPPEERHADGAGEFPS